MGIFRGPDRPRVVEGVFQSTMVTMLLHLGNDRLIINQYSIYI